ncbi:tetratricopeptide repeat protein [Paraclostridium sordellii]|uniref:Predicted O-linked N-acetylglucosamine transferase n=1 Tax=Paraclostridium sordellii TaxID=1505 RepID=A0A0C7G4N2_PARSO|nr:hypothetical protein [Paeniclostridium sordellii]CEN78268.1 Predicted O-linked N-acetylglucosamine transferase [[Clostridium] sordellii] [Paeniclostridium sordellii]CEQ03359.1 Predicted O-linked N-acetylglucosamine transferase [[Clostridium] sordellii] [Paeniclostridium sordellii]
MEYKDYLEEIKNLLWSTWDTTEIGYNEFNIIKEKLIQLYEQTNDPECFAIISELHIHKSNSHKRNAREYALKGIKEDINDSFLHGNFAIASNGYWTDFIKRNHNDLIEFYYYFTKKHPEVFIARRLLITNLIDNYRFEEALEEIENGLKFENEKNYLLHIYKGEILFRKGRIDEAFEIWSETCRAYSENYICYMAIGNQLANFARYDESIEYLKKSFLVQKIPRKIDALIALVQIFEIKKDYEEALKYTDLILQVYEKDYKIVNGDDTKIYIRNKEKFEGILSKQKIEEK